MERIRQLVFEEPGLYLFGGLVSLSLLAFGFSIEQVSNVIFWWYVACALTIGLYMTFCSVLALLMEKSIAEETTPGWNLENRPSLQDLKKTNPEEAQWMGEMYDLIDQTGWYPGIMHLVLTISIHISLVIGVFFLNHFIIYTGWWRLTISIICLVYGLVMHSEKIKEVLI